MKVTKKQLKRIIKEEKAKLIAEAKVRRLVRRKLHEGMDPLDAAARAIVVDVVDNLEPTEFIDDYEDQPGYKYDGVIEMAEALLAGAESLVDGIIPPGPQGQPVHVSIAASTLLDALKETRYRRDWLDDANEIPGAFDEVDEDTYAIEVPIRKYDGNVRKALQGLITQGGTAAPSAPSGPPPTETPGASHPPNESASHPYDLAVGRAYEIHGRSNTDVADEINIDVSDILGNDHPLAQRIEYLIDRQEDDFEGLLDEIDWAVEDGSAPADIKDKLMTNGSFD